jgi:hypothetical protein
MIETSKSGYPNSTVRHKIPHAGGLHASAKPSRLGPFYEFIKFKISFYNHDLKFCKEENAGRPAPRPIGALPTGWLQGVEGLRRRRPERLREP